MTAIELINYLATIPPDSEIKGSNATFYCCECRTDYQFEAEVITQDELHFDESSNTLNIGERNL